MKVERVTIPGWSVTYPGPLAYQNATVPAPAYDLVAEAGDDARSIDAAVGRMRQQQLEQFEAAVRLAKAAMQAEADEVRKARGPPPQPAATLAVQAAEPGQARAKASIQQLNLLRSGIMALAQRKLQRPAGVPATLPDVVYADEAAAWVPAIQAVLRGS